VGGDLHRIKGGGGGVGLVGWVYGGGVGEDLAVVNWSRGVVGTTVVKVWGIRKSA